MACGSGACAVGVAIGANLAGHQTDHHDGGSVQIDWEQPEDVSQEASGDQGHVIMTGPVAHVARGTLSNDLASLLAGGDGGDSS